MNNPQKTFPGKIGIFSMEGVGDWFLIKPVLQEIKRVSPRTKIYIVGVHKSLKYFYEKEKFIDGYSILPDHAVFEENFKYDDEIVISNFFGFIRMAGCKQHWTSLAFKMFGLIARPGIQEIPLNRSDEAFGKSYARLFHNRMIVICNDTSDTLKGWGKRRWEAVVRKCQGYVFVQVGLTGVPIKGTVNMLGKTSLAQAISLVKHAKLVVAAEGIYNHIAHILRIPRVILWGSSNPYNFGYADNAINIWKKIHCSPCAFIRKSRVKKCYKNLRRKKKIPYCMAAIGTHEVIHAIKKQLGEPHDRRLKHFVLRPSGENACLRCKQRAICTPGLLRVKYADLFTFQFI